MVDKEVKLSAKNQIVIPKEAREYVHLKPGDKLLMTISTAGHLMLWKRPRNYTEHMGGLGKELWSKINVGGYINRIRREWR